MKTKTIYTLWWTALLSFLFPGFLQSVSGQTRGLHFKGGYLKIERNINAASLRKDSLLPVHYHQHYYVLLQFDQLPDAERKKELAARGILLYDYVPGHAFLAEIKESFSIEEFKEFAVGGLYRMPVAFKIAERLQRNTEEVLHDPDQLIAIRFFGSVSQEEINRDLAQAGATIVPTKIRPDHTLFIRAGQTATIQKIAALPYVSFVAPQPIKPRSLNYNNRAAHGADALGAASGRNLQGNGVTLGIGDDSDPYTHVDFTGRLIERFPATSGSHGVHTAGTLAGGGIKDPRYMGMAPQATLISQYYTDILTNAPTYLNDYDMVLTSNSYTDYAVGCNNDGEYDGLANYTDAQLYNYPTLLHGFASGNDGSLACTPFPLQFATIKSGFQCAKNALTVGNFSNFDGTINNTSSCGPTNDGRLKPEIMTGGVGITSTFPSNNYGVLSGTSMASPTAIGTLALIVERYRQLHGGSDPPAALLKALACNTATDMGNPGPDFQFGFGSLNGRAAIEAMENGQYRIGTVNNNGNQSYTLTGIPTGLQQIRIMLYWPDYPAAPFAGTALVNNLDLTVTSPDAVTHHPLILNPSPAHVNDVAVEGIDNLNNIEQVVVNNPPGGTFTITVNGADIPTGSQNFVVTWQAIQPSVIVEYPFGNNTWVPGQPEIIRWNAYGGEPNGFTIEYSADNGSTWLTISNTVPATARLHSWTTPATATNRGLIRVTRNSTPYSDVSDYNFTVLGQPVVTATNPCQGYVQLLWNTIPSATTYDIMQLKGDTMQKIAGTTDTSFLLSNLNRDSSYWLSVRAVNGTNPGRRSLASNILPSGGACALTSLDNDYSVDSLIGPLSGRLYTSSQLGSATPIEVELKNLGTVPSGLPFTLSYRVNGGAPVTEPSSAVIAGGGGTLNYTFTHPFDFSAAGAYTIQVWVSYPGDPQPGNDTLTTVIHQLSNDPLTLTPSFTEGFESAAPGTYTSPTLGFAGLDRCDFLASNSNGRARTLVNTGFARTGSRSATLDAAHPLATSTADSLTTTFNLANYSASDQIWLDFYYMNHGIDFTLAGNQVWIRGNDQSAWVPAYTLSTDPSKIGIYQPSGHIDVSGLLRAASPSQLVSSSFQVRFGEQGYTSANSVVPDGDLDDGYSFDDITLTRSMNDVATTALVTPNTTGICNLSNAETISVMVRNYSASPITGIPVTYSINGVTVTESIPSIAAFDSTVYIFSQKADLSAYQNYMISAWVHYPGDTYATNDTLAPVSVQTVPVITTFPYLEGFENNSGYWYTGGINSSWQWGKPDKAIINKAANGTNCWVTSLSGNYNDNESSYLYSPCFDLSGLAHPVLSFSHIFQTEDDCDCDYHWVEYSTDGLNWFRLGSAGSGTNWYDNFMRQAWQLSDTIWHVSSYDIPTGAPLMKFRIVMHSDPGTNFEGVAVDDIHIFDNTPIYSGANITAGLSQPVSGNGWIDFNMGGNRVVSINPNGQDLGNTNVKAFFNTGAVRNDGRQYYLDRNIVIQPSNPPATNVSVRYYFLDTEVNNLLLASGCAGCSTIPDAYQSGVTQYSSPVLAEEDSTLSNDTSGVFHYMLPHQDVSIIPYDQGYYAEYQVSRFSEFWIDTRPATDIAMTALVSPGVPGACNLSNAETIRVKVKNNSSYALTGIPVSYSINGAVVNETIPAIAALDSVIYAFAQTADLSAYQPYGLTAWVSYSGDNDHSNDSLPVVNFQTGPVISTFPYLEGFENGSGYWYTNGTNDSWQWGTPAKPHINKAANGSNCWVTSLTGNYNNNELSYLYSPCFDLSGLTSPVLSFSHIFRTQDNCDCDYHWVEYSTDGVTWTRLGAAGSGTNWYDNSANEAWQLSDTIWHVSSYDIPVRSTTTKFRIVLKSDASTTYEGIGIDDFHIFDKGPIYSGPDIGNGLTQSVSGNNWIDFSTAGTRVASINPNGQDLGNTTVKVFFNSGPVRNDGKQYYLDRNIVIRPANTPTANVSVRFYFLDTEVDRLLQATGCLTCISLTDAYQAGVTQYSSPILTEENGLLTDDVTDTFHFLQPHNEVNIIPYDNGYYAAYQVSGFSEFWINSGSAGQNQPRLVLLSFTAARTGKDALLQWSTIQESATSRYIIEKSRDSINFFALDSVQATGNGDTVDHYQYTDKTLWSGNNYYRLKIVGNDGSFTWSPIRLVSDSDDGSVVAVYPNPVIRGGLLYITTASNCQNIRLMDVSGRSILNANAHGLFNTLPLTGIAKGIYLVGVYTDAGRKVVKIFVK